MTDVVDAVDLWLGDVDHDLAGLGFSAADVTQPYRIARSDCLRVRKTVQRTSATDTRITVTIP
ncbi:MAG: hypothetical protein ABI452_02870 [Candidatus Limnocylindrales bacterium]